MVDFALLQTIFGWMFICGLAGVVLCVILATAFALTTQAENSTCVLAGTIGLIGLIGLIVFAFVGVISKFAMWIGGFGWLAVWIYTTVVI